jgi:hypothetical protein
VRLLSKSRHLIAENREGGDSILTAQVYDTTPPHISSNRIDSAGIWARENLDRCDPVVSAAHPVE